MRVSRFVLLSLAAAASLMPLVVGARPQSTDEPRFIHHVFFWLKNPSSTADRAQLIAALQALSAVHTIRSHQIGQPADTDRDVIERGYSVSWTLAFDSAADQASYQTDPIHLRFVAENAHLWERVVVYDTVPATR